MMILDRYHNYGGLFYDRGLFRLTTPSMTKEHDLELITYNFSPDEQFDWYYHPQNSFRTYFGSFNLGMFLQGSQVRNYIPVSDRLTLPLQVTRQFDMRADRALIQLGLDYRLAENHLLGFEHTLTHQKPDLDATLFYRYGDFRTGGVEIAFTALDWGNNSAYELSQRRGTDAPELRKYETQPFFFHLRAAAPLPGDLRGEVTAGVQTPLRAVSEIGVSGGEEFRDREQARYVSMLLEYAVPGFTGGLTLRHRWARFHRTNAHDTFTEEVDYGNHQTETSLGGHVMVQYGRFYLDNWLWYNFNRDREEDAFGRFSPILPDFRYAPFTFREHRWQMQNRLGYNPDRRGFTAALEWSADYRDFLESPHVWEGGVVYAFDYRQIYPFQLTRRNERLTLILGYRFSEKIWFVTGFSYDVDGDRYGGFFENRIHPPTHFDGGFGRLVINW